MMTESQSWKFILDASALIEMLGTKRSSDQSTGRRRVQPGKLTQLARNGLVWVTTAVAEEVLSRSDVIADLVNETRGLTQPSAVPDTTTWYGTVTARTNHLPSFQNSVADMEGVCTALAFNDQSPPHEKAAIVVRGDQYEAACFTMGVTALSPAVFVLNYCSLPIQ